MIKRNSPIEKIEDALWRLRRYYDKKARFYQNMYQDILLYADRIDNQEYEPQDFLETSDEGRTHQQNIDQQQIL